MKSLFEIVVLIAVAAAIDWRVGHMAFRQCRSSLSWEGLCPPICAGERGKRGKGKEEIIIS